MHAVNVNRNLQSCESVASKIVNDTGFNLNWGELLLRARNDRSSLISRCTFAGEDCTNEFTPVNTVAGVCYTLDHLLNRLALFEELGYDRD